MVSTARELAAAFDDIGIPVLNLADHCIRHYSLHIKHQSFHYAQSQKTEFLSPARRPN